MKEEWNEMKVKRNEICDLSNSDHKTRESLSSGILSSNPVFLWTYPWVLVSTVKLWEGVHAEDYDSRRVIEFTRRRAGGWWNSREHLLREVDGVRKEKERLTAAQRISGWNESASEREILSMSQKNRLLWRLIPLFGGQKESAVMKELIPVTSKVFQ